MTGQASAPLLDVIRAIAFIGDLAMGQPIDHSMQAAWIASRISKTIGESNQRQTEASLVALLRWSGCTANTPEFSQLFGDDITGRQSMLATLSASSGLRQGTAHKKPSFFSLSKIHCEVSGEISRLLGLDVETQFALSHLFESYDGNGAPQGLRGSDIPNSVYLSSLAGDLEIYSRLYGHQQACTLISSRADSLYPSHLAAVVIANSELWLSEMSKGITYNEVFPKSTELHQQQTQLELVADIIDLKLPWMLGFSRQTAKLACTTAVKLGLSSHLQKKIYSASLIHGLGRASVPNKIWDLPRPLSASEWEQVHLVPYWTFRTIRQIDSLAHAAELASYSYERSNGSGYFRGVSAKNIPLGGQILAAATTFTACMQPRPWREAMTHEDAFNLLQQEAQEGRLDKAVVNALLSGDQCGMNFNSNTESLTLVLTKRELDVLRCISGGASNKVTAIKLSISHSTVRTHMESIFRKLGCTTRAAATLKAIQLGLLDSTETT